MDDGWPRLLASEKGGRVQRRCALVCGLPCPYRTKHRNDLASKPAGAVSSAVLASAHSHSVRVIGTVLPSAESECDLL